MNTDKILETLLLELLIDKNKLELSLEALMNEPKIDISSVKDTLTKLTISEATIAKYHNMVASLNKEK